MADEFSSAFHSVEPLTATPDILSSIQDTLRDINLRLTLLEVRQEHQQLHTSLPTTQSSPASAILDSSFHTLTPNNSFKAIQIAIPRFADDNPEAWIQKMEQYYGFHKLSDADKLTLTSFHMDGQAEEWYLWLCKTKRLTTWSQIVTALRSRFGPSKYRDLRGELA